MRILQNSSGERVRPWNVGFSTHQRSGREGERALERPGPVLPAKAGLPPAATRAKKEATLWCASLHARARNRTRRFFSVAAFVPRYSSRRPPPRAPLQQPRRSPGCARVGGWVSRLMLCLTFFFSPLHSAGLFLWLLVVVPDFRPPCHWSHLELRQLATRNVSRDDSHHVQLFFCSNYAVRF